MKNWIIVLLIFTVPLAVFAWLETNSGKSIAKETVASETVAKNDVADGASLASHSNAVTTAKPRVLKFSSPMCSDCKKVSGEMVKVVPDYKDAITFEEVNVTDGTKESAAAVKDYKVTVVPTLVFIAKDGKIVRKAEGFLTESEIRTHLDNIK